MCVCLIICGQQLQWNRLLKAVLVNSNVKRIFKYSLVVLRPLFLAAWDNDWPGLWQGQSQTQPPDLLCIPSAQFGARWCDPAFGCICSALQQYLMSQSKYSSLHHPSFSAAVLTVIKLGLFIFRVRICKDKSNGVNNTAVVLSLSWGE